MVLNDDGKSCPACERVLEPRPLLTAEGWTVGRFCGACGLWVERWPGVWDTKQEAEKASRAG